MRLKLMCVYIIIPFRREKERVVVILMIALFDWTESSTLEDYITLWILKFITLWTFGGFFPSFYFCFYLFGFFFYQSIKCYWPSHFSMCEIYNLYGHHVWSIHLSLSFFHWWKCSIGSSPHENKQIMSPLFAIFFCLKGVEKNGLFRNWIKIIQGALAS